MFWQKFKGCVVTVKMSKRPNNHPPVCQKSCSRMVGIYNMGFGFAELSLNLNLNLNLLTSY